MQRPSLIFLNQVMCCLAFALAANPAHADDEAAGRVLFNDAIFLMKKGALDEACPKFEESLRQSYNINAQYFLADCLERQGRTATAWTTFLSTATKARAAGDARREQSARKRAGVLEARLVRLRIVVAHEVDALEVRRNGTLVGKPMWGALVPVDPGEIEFTVSAPGFEPYKETVNVVGDGRIVEVAIPRLARKLKVIASLAPPPPVEEPRPVVVPPTPPVEARTAAPQSGAHTLQKIGWVVGGVGVLTMAGGGVLALLARSSFNSAKTAFDECTDMSCEDQNLEKERSAIRKANWATGLFIGGAAATVVGVVLVIAGSGESDESHPSLSVGFSPAGVSLAGRF
jgi:hypothetical protein